MKNKELAASVLAFERKLSNSDGRLYAGKWENRFSTSKSDWTPIAIRTKAVRGTISNRQKTSIQNDPAKLDTEIQKPNLQRVHVATLPFSADTLQINFTLRILGNIEIPCVCNSAEYQSKLSSIIRDYINEHGCKELAHRYAHNLANGRFLWRNRIGAEKIEICIDHIENENTINTLRFNGTDFDLQSFSNKSSEIQELSEVIEKGLSGKKSTFLRITGFAYLGKGQEVFPSQELVTEKENSQPSKILYEIVEDNEESIAGMHSQKIGNAIRTIDTWHPHAEEIGPIAVEPFGAVTNRGKAYRQPKEKKDFYSLLDNWMKRSQKPDISQQHYLMAMFIRGGVFSEADKNSK